MIKEIIKKAPTVDEAINLAVEELGVKKELCNIEVLDEPKKSLFGKMKDAKVKVSCDISEENTSVLATEDNNVKKLEVAKKYLTDIIKNMGLENVTLVTKEDEKGATITFEGDGVAILIGHHGETLDALQYLAALACNRIDGDYFRITLDCGNYRDKREETLKGLAKRVGENVKRTGRSQMLEPMNPYERRIIHSIVSEINGVSSHSKGEEPNRRVLIVSDTPRPRYNNNNNNNKRDDYKRSSAPKKRELTMEEILKGDIKEKVDGAELYSKIEL